MARDTDALIIGGGIGGLAAALALARAGWRVGVREQSTQLGEVGAGLSITPNGGKALRALGLGPALERMGSRPDSGAITHYATGEVLVPLAQQPATDAADVPLCHVHRADLHEALRAALLERQPDCLRLDCAFTGLTQYADDIEATFADGRRDRARLLIGCDGIRSAVRDVLHGAARPNFTGYVAWRGLIPTQRVDTPLRNPPLNMSLAPGRLLMRYPLREGTLINYVAVARSGVWTEESWTVRSELDDLLGQFSDFNSQTLKLLALTPPDRCFKWGLCDRDPLPHWTAGRATLLGDAAHAMPPFTGQGAVMALEDAAILGRAASGQTAAPAVLQVYEAARRERTYGVLALSRACGELYFAEDPATRIEALAAGMREQRRLYSYDAGQIALAGAQ